MLNLSAATVRNKILHHKRLVQVAKSISSKVSKRLDKRSMAQKKYYGTLTREHLDFVIGVLQRH